MRFALVPSPFVGPNTWQIVSDLMQQARVIDYGGVAAPAWYDGAAHRIVEQMDDDPWVAVLHSSAGPFAPSLAASSQKLHGLVFVDAVLPHPGSSVSEITPPSQLEQLRKLTSPAGVLAKWNTWLPAEVLEAWVPDTHFRTEIISAIPQVPFAFLEAQAPDHDSSWEDLPAAFIRLSGGFERNAVRAEERGWIVKRMEVGHLGMVSHANDMAAALTALRW